MQFRAQREWEVAPVGRSHPWGAGTTERGGVTRARVGPVLSCTEMPPRSPDFRGRVMEPRRSNRCQRFSQVPRERVTYAGFSPFPPPPPVAPLC